MLFLYFFFIFVILLNIFSYKVKLLVSTTRMLNNHCNPIYYQKSLRPSITNISDKVIMYKYDIYVILTLLPRLYSMSYEI